MGDHDFKLNKVPFPALKSVNIFVIYFFIKSSNRIVQLHAYQLYKYN